MFDGLKSSMKLNASKSSPVFLTSFIAILLLVLLGSIWPNQAQEAFKVMQTWFEQQVGWLYIAGVAIFLVFMIAVMFSRFGDIKLGPDHAEPEYSYKSWIAMLFSAGMGIGLMFFGVAEPVMHYLAPPDADPLSIAAAKDAMKITFFHWGVHAWAIYAIVALNLAYFAYRHKLPLLPRSALYPIFGERIYGPIGHAVDSFAVIGTMFGVATSLGFGVLQLNTGLNHLFGVPITPQMQVIFIIAITAVATISVFSGLDKGVKRLSELNLVLAFFLMFCVIVLGPTVLLLQSFVQNTGGYLSDIVNKTFNLYAYEKKNDWLGGWTLLYWGWWISWSPFVGTFIARVSRGRTIREFLVGVLFVPTAFTFLWMTVFGNSAIDLMMTQAGTYLGDAVAKDSSIALFVFFEQLPFSTLLSVLALCLVVTFFVTSSDSGSLVIDNLASGGDINSPVWKRIFWALLQGVVASVLLLAGGLQALQTLAIASALPFLIIMLMMCFGLYRALQDDWLKLQSVSSHNTVVQFAKTNVSWQEHIDVLVARPSELQAQQFITDVAKPALKQVLQCFVEKGTDASMATEEDRVRFIIKHDEFNDFIYSLRVRAYNQTSAVEVEVQPIDDTYYRVEVFLEHGGQHYDVMGFTEEQILADVVTQYEKYLHYLHVAKAEYVSE